MTAYLAYLYCTGLTKEEEIAIDIQVSKNREEFFRGFKTGAQASLRLSVFFSFSAVPMFTTPMAPFFPVEGFSPQQIIRNGRDRVESAIAEKMARLAQDCEEAYEAYEEYKVYSEMSSTLSKVSSKLRKDEETKKHLDDLTEQLKNGQFVAGRGAHKLAGTETIYYLLYEIRR